MTLYLKYRPQKLNDLDITSVRESLTKIVNSGNIPHAFLFSGPKGTGKTSSARILSKVIICESKKAPCDECNSCISVMNGTNIDVIEMDAASNRGIDDIRSLKDAVKLAPTSSKAKVYIIDEAHMLTTEASNALLKTLEEPPSHVYFILATTNPEKLISTIRSRTTEIFFTKATNEETERSLKRVVSGENIKITKENVSKILKLSKGSFRDAVKLLEQYVSDDKFLENKNMVDTVVFTENLLKKDLKSSLGVVDMAIKNGVSIESLVSDVLENLQKELLKLEDKDVAKLIELILEAQEYNKVTPIEELPLQIAIIKWCNL